MNPSDAEKINVETYQLTKQLIKKNITTFHTIFEQERQRCFSLAYNLLGNSEDAQDVVQESFLKLWNHCHTLDVQQGYQRWLFRCVLNTGIDYLRRRQKNPSMQSPPNLTEVLDPRTLENTLETEETRIFLQRKIRYALAQLDEKYRTVIVLRIWEKLSYKEIAELLQIPLGTAGRRFTVGLSKLEAFLDPKKSSQ